MTIKALYNVGVITIGSSQKNLYSASADGQPFLFIRDGSLFSYITADMLRSFMALQLAVVDSRLNVYEQDNTNAPTYTAAPGDGKVYRTVVLSNGTDAMKEAYSGQPYYSLRGDTIAEYAGTDVTYANTNNLVAMNATADTATTPTGIAFVDNLWAFVQANIIWVLAGFVALAYLGIFDPLGLFKKGKKKMKKG